MKINVILLIAVCSVFACSSKKSENNATDLTEVVETPQAKAAVKNINKNELVRLLEKSETIQLVDVRTAGETSQGTIEGAISEMDFLSGQFENKLNELDKDKPVVVYCASGRRSAQAAEILIKNDFKKVYNYTGGYSDWSN